jgi:hypothetical protein
VIRLGKWRTYIGFEEWRLRERKLIREEYGKRIWTNREPSGSLRGVGVREETALFRTHERVSCCCLEPVFSWSTKGWASLPIAVGTKLQSVTSDDSVHEPGCLGEATRCPNPRQHQHVKQKLKHQLGSSKPTLVPSCLTLDTRYINVNNVYSYQLNVNFQSMLGW